MYDQGYYLDLAKYGYHCDRIQIHFTNVSQLPLTALLSSKTAMKGPAKEYGHEA